MTDESQTAWCVYMVECSGQSLYTGITNDVELRLQQHNQEVGARYMCSRLPVTLVYSEAAADRSAASVREAQIKRLTVIANRALVTG